MRRSMIGSALLTVCAFALLGASGCSKEEMTASDGGVTSSDFGMPAVTSVVVNEVFPHGADPLTDPDWAELKNTGTTTVDLSGYRVRDDSSLLTLPAGTTLAPGQYLVIYCDDGPDGGASDRLHAPFKLGKQDELYLLRPDGEKVDGITWDATTAPSPNSYGRLPDGSGQWNSLTPTKGTRNGV